MFSVLSYHHLIFECSCQFFQNLLQNGNANKRKSHFVVKTIHFVLAPIFCGRKKNKMETFPRKRKKMTWTKKIFGKKNVYDNKKFPAKKNQKTNSIKIHS